MPLKHRSHSTQNGRKRGVNSGDSTTFYSYKLGQSIQCDAPCRTEWDTKSRGYKELALNRS